MKKIYRFLFWRGGEYRQFSRFSWVGRVGCGNSFNGWCHKVKDPIGEFVKKIYLNEIK